MDELLSTIEKSRFPMSKTRNSLPILRKKYFIHANGHYKAGQKALHKARRQLVVMLFGRYSMIMRSKGGERTKNVNFGVLCGQRERSMVFVHDLVW